MNEAFVGFDSAWSSQNKGAICYAIYRKDVLIEVGFPQSASFTEAAGIIGELQAKCADVLIAIDQPLIVPNRSGPRPVDRVAKSFMGKLGSGAQSAARSGNGNQTAMFGDAAPVWNFISDIGSCTYSGENGNACNRIVDYADAKTLNGQTHTHLVEVYPALALPALESRFIDPRHRVGDSHKERRWAARYDPRGKHFCTHDWRLVCETVSRCANNVGLPSLSHWVNERGNRWESPNKPKKSDQDKIDAVLCLAIAFQWRRLSNTVSVIGDLEAGYILIPTSDDTVKLLRESIERKKLQINLESG